jgi:uncharacterized repeat protein (TIGR03803 family)
MRRNARSLLLNWALPIVLFGLTFAGSSRAVNVKGEVLYSFNGEEGGVATGTLTIDTLGNLYGTTALGGEGTECGNFACGVVYELSPSANGYTQTVLWTFTNGADGGGPQGGVIRDSLGNLYGTTLYAGGGNGCGTVFQLTPNSNGGWNNNTLHNFGSISNDACFPYSGLTFDSAGNLYGTTASGGPNLTGAVFELIPSEGGWDYKVIYNFQEGGSGDGANPHGTLVFDQAGNIYGTTLNGGPSNAGSVFELTPSNGVWNENVIYAFGGATGANPYAGVIFDSQGNLYGTTNYGGTNNAGVAYELSPSGNGWTIQVIHNFGGPSDGANPGAGSLLMDGGGLWGETYGGGRGFGTVFELVSQNGEWNEGFLYRFSDKEDGGNPSGGLAMDAQGNLYGTDQHGGSGEMGIVFEGKMPSEPNRGNITGRK